MRAHVIESGVVVNTIEVDSLDVFPEMLLIDAALGGQIGGSWDGQVFTPPAPPLEPVPFSVSARQCRLELFERGLIDLVPQIIASIPDEYERRRAEIEWEFAPMVERTTPLVEVIRVATNKTAAEIDDMFRRAEKR